MKIKNKKGQSTVEYILLVTAVTLVVILFTTSRGPGSFQNGLNQVLNETTSDMLNVAARLQVNGS